MLEALPLQDNILTNQLIVDNVNEIKQPIMYEYISENEEDTQGVLSLNINGARVLSEYSNATPITTNGLHEFDVVDSNVNMPVMNYKVNVNVPQPSVYNLPDPYTTKRITSSNDYILADLVNGDLTNYNYLAKNIPVTIDVDTTIYLDHISYGGTDYVKSNMQKTTADGNISVGYEKTILFYNDMGSNYFELGLMENAGSAKNIYMIKDVYYIIVTMRTNAQLNLYNTNNQLISIIKDPSTGDSLRASAIYYRRLLDDTYF